jgi:membrane associated rhomboid family serine protease
MFFPIRDDNPTRRPPWVTHGVIALNVLVYAYFSIEELSGMFWVTHWYGLVPARLLADVDGESFTVLSSMFMHGGLYHLGTNMWFLHVFGDNVEDAMGRPRYLGFYLGCGLAAAAAQVLADPSSTVPMVGASGAVSGVLGAYLLLYPRAPVLSLNTVPLLWLFTGIFVVLPAWVIAGIYFLSNLISAYWVLGSANGAGVAFFAHLGGFLAGVVFVRWGGSRSRGLRPRAH